MNLDRKQNEAVAKARKLKARNLVETVFFLWSIVACSCFAQEPNEITWLRPQSSGTYSVEASYTTLPTVTVEYVDVNEYGIPTPGDTVADLDDLQAVGWDYASYTQSGTHYALYGNTFGYFHTFRYPVDPNDETIPMYGKRLFVTVSGLPSGTHTLYVAGNFYKVSTIQYSHGWFFDTTFGLGEWNSVAAGHRCNKILQGQNWGTEGLFESLLGYYNGELWVDYAFGSTSPVTEISFWFQPDEWTYESIVGAVRIETITSSN